MDFLIDTHIYVWMLDNNTLLSKETRKILLDKSNTFYISIESIREIAIKHRNGKITLPVFFKTFCGNYLKKYGIKVLVIKMSHLHKLNTLAPALDHNDPFDHLIISQAITEDLCLISADKHFPFYVSQGLKLFVNE